MDRTAQALRLIEMTIPCCLLLMNDILFILWFGNWELGIGGPSDEGMAAAIVIYATRITGTSVCCLIF